MTNKNGFGNQFDPTQYFKFFENMKMPQGNMESMMGPYRKNMETLSSIHQTLLEGAKSLAQLQSQYARQGMENVMHFSKSMANSGNDYQQKVDICSQAVQNNLKTMTEHGQDVGDVLQKTQEKVTSIAGKSFEENAQQGQKMAKEAMQK